jgi:DNA-binding MarR family transcriptional regulator
MPTHFALSRGWSALQREVLSPFGLNYAELSTLGFLRTSLRNRRNSPSELRQRLGQSSAGMTRILDKLEQASLLRREACEDDARRLDVALTRRGAHRADEAFAALLGIESELLAPLGKRRLQEVLRAFDALHESLAGDAG